MDKKTLIEHAFQAQKKAYTPYSRFQVGAALLTKSGKIYKGCNIENASYGASNCAERTAFFRAVYDGEREFEGIAIVGKPMDSDTFEYCAPCGICRQVMAEFGEDDFLILLAKSPEEYQEFTLKELLPLRFTSKDMEIR